jgi:hypothetical protein
MFAAPLPALVSKEPTCSRSRMRIALVILCVVVALVALYVSFSRGPFGLHAAYQREVRLGLARLTQPEAVTEADLTPLPSALQRYLRFAGVVGQPRVQNYRIRFAGRIRSAENAPWMEFTGEQHSFVDRPTRLFMMDAKMNGVPVDVFHSYVNGAARMQVKVLSLYPMVDASGFDFTTAETVTLFNDMCVMAPATLIDPAITWKEIDDQSVQASFSNAGHTIHAVLTFDGSGALVNFTSDDRPALAPDGKTFVPQRWSTPLTSYSAFGAFTLASRGDAHYAAASGEYTYLEFELQDVAYNVAQ